LVVPMFVCLESSKGERQEKKSRNSNISALVTSSSKTVGSYPYFLWVTSKSILPSSIAASGHQHCCQIVGFCYFEYLPESTPGFSAASLFYVMDQCNNCYLLNSRIHIMETITRMTWSSNTGLMSPPCQT